jgi:hypothetical protein
MVHKRTITALAVPTVSPSEDHTDGSWGVNDIYSGEFYLNETDVKLYIRVAGVIKEIPLAAGADGNGIFDAANDGGTVPTSYSINVADLVTWTAPDNSTSNVFFRLESLNGTGYLEMDGQGNLEHGGVFTITTGNVNGKLSVLGGGSGVTANFSATSGEGVRSNSSNNWAGRFRNSGGSTFKCMWMADGYCALWKTGTPPNVADAWFSVVSDNNIAASKAAWFRNSGIKDLFIIQDDGVCLFSTFTIATLPAVVAGGIIRVSDETGGDTLAYSDGVNWLRMSDGTIVA